MASQNIQHLFAAIRPEQVAQYLTKQGWQCHLSGERFSFELPAEDPGETRQMVLPAERSHPRYRKLLPNLIFNLSVMEKREALEIANAIADQSVQSLAEIAASAAPTVMPAANPAAVQAGPQASMSAHAKPDDIEWTTLLVNASEEQPITVRSRFGAAQITLPAGQTLRVCSKPNSMLRVQLKSDCELDFTGATVPHLFFGQPQAIEQWHQRGLSLADGLREYLQTACVGDSETSVAGVAAQGLAPEWIELAVSEFVFLVGSDIPVANVSTLMRASARLLMQVHQRLHDHAGSDSVVALFQLAQLLMFLGKLVFMADDSLAGTLARTMELDSPIAPAKTLEWLTLHSQRA